MKTSNEEKLFKNYPTLFPNGRKVSPMESLICFGIECDDGWFDLIEELCCKILALPRGKEVVAVQVKEKFGGLRFYTHGYGGDDLWNLIREAEGKSYEACEVCGKKGKLRDDIGWYRTLCEKHYEPERKRVEGFKKKHGK